MKSVLALIAAIVVMNGTLTAFAQDGGGQGGTGHQNAPLTAGGGGPKHANEKDGAGQGGNGHSVQSEKEGSGQGGNG